MWPQRATHAEIQLILNIINQTFNNSSAGRLTDLKKGPGKEAETAIVVVASQWKSHTALPDVYPAEKKVLHTWAGPERKYRPAFPV